MQRKIIVNELAQIHPFGDDVLYDYRLVSEGTDAVVLRLNKQQHSLLEKRVVRQYLVLCNEARLYDMIENAPNYKELENIARKYSLCDTCDFSDINIYGVKRILRVVVRSLYKYPKLRGKLCYIGSPCRYLKKMEQLESGNLDILKDFGIQYICRTDIAVQLGALMRKVASSVLSKQDSYIALAVYAYGLFDAVLLDEQDYEGYAYINLVSNIRRDAASGFHPKGCQSIESVMYHEIGHMLDFLCGLSEKPEMIAYANSLSKFDIAQGLSTYATTSTAEMIAEAFAEYMCSDTPREIAQRIVRIINAEYSKL